MSPDRSLSLEQRDGDVWPDPAFWRKHAEFRARLDAIVRDMQHDLQHKRETLEKQILPAWQEIYGG